MLEAKRKVEKTSVREVLKTIMRVDSERPFATCKITSKQAKKRLDWVGNAKKSSAAESLDPSRVRRSHEEMFRIKEGAGNPQVRRLRVFGDDDPGLFVHEGGRFPRGVAVSFAGS